MIITPNRWAVTFALVLLSPFAVAPVRGAELLATSIFPAAGEADPAADLDGVFKIDLSTGEATPFIPQGTAGLVAPAGVAVGPHDGNIYVGSNASGQIYVFDGETGSPVESPERGIAGGRFANLGADVGVASLLFDESGLLYVAASPSLDVSQGFVARLEGDRGERLEDAVSGIVFPNGMTLAGDGTLLVTTGDLAAPGSIVQVTGGVATTLIANDNGQFLDAISVLIAPPSGDYDSDGNVDGGEFLVWQRAFGDDVEPAGSGADGDGSGVVDADDLTVWDENLGATGDILVADFIGTREVDEVKGNPIISFDSDGTNPQLFSLVGPHIPDELPPGVFLASNFPSQLLLTPQRTLLVSALGLTNRPDNRGAVWEYDLAGNLLRGVATDLPPISSIALAPAAGSRSASVPAPTTAWLAVCGALTAVSVCRRRGAGTANEN